MLHVAVLKRCLQHKLPQKAVSSSLCVTLNFTNGNAGNIDTADKGSDREDVPLQACLKRLKRVHNATAAPPTGPATASAFPASAHGGSSRHVAQHVKPKGLSKQDQRR